MPKTYNEIAGTSVERLAALSDGLFAIAMTLLIIELHAPAAAAIHSEGDLWRSLAGLAPQLVMYLVGFLTLGIFWVGQQTQLNFLAQGDRHLTWLHLAFLFAVAVMPFSTALMAEFIAYRTALLVYWANLALFGALLFATWRYAEHARLVKSDAPSDLCAGLERRVVIAQSLYAFGALLCVFDTRWSLGFIVLVQLNYAIAPRLPLLSRL